MTSEHRRSGHSLDSLPAEVRAWLRGLAENGEAVVTSVDEKDSTVILLTRKGRSPSIARWRTLELRILSFGPPDRDLLVHDDERNVLSVRARPPGLRDIRLGRRAGRLLLAGPAPAGWDPDTRYSLEPLEKGTFNWGGDERIAGIVLTRVCLRVPGAMEAYLTVDSADVRRTLREEIPQFTVEGGELVHVQFRFTLEVGDGEERVSFTVKPPATSDLPQKPHRDIIGGFLREQGVMRG
jgi:hypothetical protein